MSTETERSTADAMPPQEYRDILAGLGLTQGGGAALLGVDARTSRKWANGEREIPPTAARFLRFITRQGISAEEVLRVLSS